MLTTCTGPKYYQTCLWKSSSRPYPSAVSTLWLGGSCTLLRSRPARALYSALSKFIVTKLGERQAVDKVLVHSQTVEMG
jgi:hypothetical protein